MTNKEILTILEERCFTYENTYFTFKYTNFSLSAESDIVYKVIKKHEYGNQVQILQSDEKEILTSLLVSSKTLYKYFTDKYSENSKKIFIQKMDNAYNDILIANKLH